MLTAELVGAEVLTPEGLMDAPLALSRGQIVASRAPGAVAVDLSDYRVLPGIVDAHGDGFERHVAPRRGAMKDMGVGLRAAEAEMAANGITTGVVAQFISWEGGLRGEAFAAQVFETLQGLETITDLVPQARFETHQLDLYEAFPDRLDGWGVRYVVFNDHLPHDRLEMGKMPRRLTGQALKAGRSPEAHLKLIEEMHARRDEVPDALDRLCPALAARGIRMGSHDDATPEQRAVWQARGVAIAEFPETLEAAEAPGPVILGAPNLVRGGSHKGNVSALDVVMTGNCDALASDYHYPSPRRAALFLARTMGLAAAWHLVSAGPAALLGFSDRGQLAPGYRADLVILDETDAVAATMSGGRVSYMSGDIVERFLDARA